MTFARHDEMSSKVSRAERASRSVTVMTGVDAPVGLADEAATGPGFATGNPGGGRSGLAGRVGAGLGVGCGHCFDWGSPGAVPMGCPCTCGTDGGCDSVGGCGTEGGANIPGGGGTEGGSDIAGGGGCCGICGNVGDDCDSAGVEALGSGTVSGGSVGKSSGISSNFVGGGTGCASREYGHGHGMVVAHLPGVVAISLGAPVQSMRDSADSPPDVAAKSPLVGNDSNTAMSWLSASEKEMTVSAATDWKSSSATEGAIEWPGVEAPGVAMSVSSPCNTHHDSVQTLMGGTVAPVQQTAAI